MPSPFQPYNQQPLGSTTITHSEAGSIEFLLDQKTAIVKKKLDILTIEIFMRLGIWSRNLERIDKEIDVTKHGLEVLVKQMLYQGARHGDIAPSYKNLWQLETERRAEDKEVWRDVSQVMRDWLMTWEAHENARARGRFVSAI